MKSGQLTANVERASKGLCYLRIKLNHQVIFLGDFIIAILNGRWNPSSERITDDWEDNIDDPRNGPPPIDFKKHISDNVSKGSSLCPLGSAIMGKAMRLEKDLNDLSEKSDGKAFDINGFDENATDSDDDLLSDLEETADLSWWSFHPQAQHVLHSPII